MTGWVLDTLLWTAVLIAVVLVLRRPVARWFGPGVAYALWMLPLARLVLPPLLLPAGWFSTSSSARFAPVATNPVPEAAGADMVATTVMNADKVGFVLPWEMLLASAWLCGAVLFLFVRIVEYRAMRRALLADAIEVDRRGGIRLVETRAVAAPVAFGIRDKVVALPPRFLISGHLAERALAIEHELAHHRGGDLLANWLAQPLLALHWFNPLAWIAWNAMRRDQEAACDARVLADADTPTRVTYARVIAGFAAGSRLGPRAALAAPMACPVLGDKSIIHRLRSLTMTDISARRRRTGRWVLGAGAVVALPLTATIVHAVPDAPEPPAAPSAPAAPTVPAAPVKKIEKRIVVVEHGESDDDADARTTKFEKRLEQDGKTVVIRSNRPIDEAELEAKLAKLDTLEKLKDKDWDIALPTGEPGERRVIRRTVTHDGDDHHEGKAIAMVITKCGRDPTLAEADAHREAGSAGTKSISRTHVLLCGKAGLAKADALAKVRSTRESIASSETLSSDIRADIVRQLDEAIARLESAAG